jgi:hypothetical protein
MAVSTMVPACLSRIGRRSGRIRRLVDGQLDVITCELFECEQHRVKEKCFNLLLRTEIFLYNRYVDSIVQLGRSANYINVLNVLCDILSTIIALLLGHA